MKTYIKILGLLFIYICATSDLSAQTFFIEGKVVDSKTKAPVPYSSLGIKGKNEGSVSNEKGEFRFSIQSENSSSDLIISSLGYQESKIAAIAFKKGYQTIELTPLAQQLNEVVINSEKKIKTKTIGRAKTGFITFSKMFNASSPAEEQGTLLNIPENTFINDFGFHILPSSRFKMVKMRLNIYSVKDNRPDSSLIQQNVIFEISQPGWVKIDLKEYHIHVKGQKQIALTCQLLESTPLDGIPFSFGVSAVPSGHSILTRNKSQTDWNSSKGTLTFNSSINYIQ